MQCLPSYNTFSLRFGPHPQPLPVDLDILIDRFSEDEIRDASRSAGALLQAADQAGDDLMSKRSTYEEITHRLRQCYPGFSDKCYEEAITQGCFNAR